MSLFKLSFQVNQFADNLIFALFVNSATAQFQQQTDEEKQHYFSKPLFNQFSRVLLHRIWNTCVRYFPIHPVPKITKRKTVQLSKVHLLKSSGNPYLIITVTVLVIKTNKTRWINLLSLTLYLSCYTRSLTISTSDERFIEAISQSKRSNDRCTASLIIGSFTSCSHT